MRWICTVGMINGHVNEHTKNLKERKRIILDRLNSAFNTIGFVSMKFSPFHLIAKH